MAVTGGITERELAFMEAERARELRRKEAERERELDLNIKPVIESRGQKHFADLMGLGPTKQDRIYHWTERRNNQRPPAELMALVHEDPSPEGEKAMGDYCEARGYERPRRKLPASGERLARVYEEKLRSFGGQGERAIEEAQREAAKPEPKEWERTTPVRVAGTGGSR